MQSVPEDAYHEQWVSGTYIVAGIFLRRSESIRSGQIQSDISGFFDLLKKKRKRRWPRGICAYYAIPVYICDKLDFNAVKWVHSRPRYRYAMWHEPVLYDRHNNLAEMNAAWGLYSSSFRSFLSNLIFAALSELADHEGHVSFPQTNGKQIEFGKGKGS